MWYTPERLIAKLQSVNRMEEISHLMLTVLKPHVRRSDASAVGFFAAFWGTIVGRAIAGNSRPIAFADGTLTLETDCPNWTVQLQSLEREIREAVNRFLGEPRVTSLRVHFSGSARELQRTIARREQRWL